MVYKYFVQILEGVDFLHQRNIYHSDIKPSNILLTSDDNIKLCDFRIAVGLQWQTESFTTSTYLKVIIITKVRNLTIFNYHQKIDILVRINQCKTNSIKIFNFRDNYF